MEEEYKKKYIGRLMKVNKSKYTDLIPGYYLVIGFDNETGILKFNDNSWIFGPPQTYEKFILDNPEVFKFIGGENKD